MHLQISNNNTINSLEDLNNRKFIDMEHKEKQLTSITLSASRRQHVLIANPDSLANFELINHRSEIRNRSLIKYLVLVPIPTAVYFFSKSSKYTAVSLLFAFCLAKYISKSSYFSNNSEVTFTDASSSNSLHKLTARHLNNRQSITNLNEHFSNYGFTTLQERMKTQRMLNYN